MEKGKWMENKMAESIIDNNIFAELKETMGADFIGELIDTFLQETPQLVDELCGALAAQDADLFRRTAHSIKSSTAAFGAVELSSHARELEMMGKAGDLSGADPKVEQLKSDFEQAQKALVELKNGS